MNKKKTQYSKRRKSYSKAWAGGFSIWATVVNFSITNWSRVTDKMFRGQVIMTFRIYCIIVKACPKGKGQAQNVFSLQSVFCVPWSVIKLFCIFHYSTTTNLPMSREPYNVHGGRPWLYMFILFLWKHICAVWENLHEWLVFCKQPQVKVLNFSYNVFLFNHTCISENSHEQYPGFQNRSLIT